MDGNFFSKTISVKENCLLRNFQDENFVIQEKMFKFYEKRK